MNERIVVAHPHKQHSFQFASALEADETLERYVTTVYNKPGSITARLISMLSPTDQSKAASRRSAHLPDNKVLQMCEARGLLYLLVLRLTKNNKKIMEPLDSWINRAFGNKLARYAIDAGASAVVCYDTQSEALFSRLDNRNSKIIKVLDVSAANLLFLKTIYENDMVASPQFGDLLRKERPHLLEADESSGYFKSIKNELAKSDYFIAPSSFVRSSLVYSGVSEDKIYIQPYGINIDEYDQKNSYTTKSPLRFIYVGGIKQIKGIGYLLEAFSSIDKSEATLTVVGGGDIDGTCLEKYADAARFEGPVLHGDIPSLLRNHDVFLFPSLGDSFGFAPLEAAACGLPLVVSQNTGLADYISEGQEGFIIPPHSSGAIEERIRWFLENRDSVESMGNRAREMACTLSLNSYYSGIRAIMKKIHERSPIAE